MPLPTGIQIFNRLDSVPTPVIPQSPRQMDANPDLTRLLNDIDSGDPRAAEDLLPLVYAELRRLASAQMAGEKPGQTLQATALVHEAWLRVSGNCERSWNGRQHFFRTAAEAMRRILVDRARQRLAIKRGGGKHHTELSETKAGSGPMPDEELLALSEALEILKKRDPVAAELVHLRYFAGLNMSASADLLNIPLRTAERTWTHTRAWLRKEMKP